MLFKAIPRQKPHCSLSDFIIFFKMLLRKNLIRGRNIKEFELQFVKRYGIRHGLAVSSCRSAFALIIDALGIKKDDEVILPAFNLSAFPKILKFKEIRPVFVDADEKTFNIDVNQIEHNITSKTKAIVVVHLFGNTCDMERIMTIAKKYNLNVIEDCANAFMTKYKDSYVGTYGDVACFSLGHSKDVPTFGGGIIATNDDHLYKNMCRLHESDFTFPGMSEMIKIFFKNIVLKISTSRIIFMLFVYPFVLFFARMGLDIIAHFIEDKDKMIAALPKKRFTNFQASIGITKLNENNCMQQKRIDIARSFNNALSGLKGVAVPKIIEGGNHAYWNYTALSSNRSALLKKLIVHGIDAKRIYAYDCNSLEIFKEFRKACPISKRISKEILALPIYHYLKGDEIVFINEMMRMTVSNLP